MNRTYNHYCWLFTRGQSHREIITRFITEGMKNKEKIIYIADINSAAKIVNYINNTGQAMETGFAGEQLEIISSHDVYIKQGFFDPCRILDSLDRVIDRSLAEGFTGLRVTGEMTWILRDVEGTEMLVDYEAMINDHLKGRNVLALCQYDLRYIRPKEVIDVMVFHPAFILETETYPNSYYFPR
ncbi:MAG: MEDS domain-containing protein [Candidatus Odinarchaeota archaeon]